MPGLAPALVVSLSSLPPRSAPADRPRHVLYGHGALQPRGRFISCVYMDTQILSRPWVCTLAAFLSFT